MAKRKYKRYKIKKTVTDNVVNLEKYYLKIFKNNKDKINLLYIKPEDKLKKLVTNNNYILEEYVSRLRILYTDFSNKITFDPNYLIYNTFDRKFLLMISKYLDYKRTLEKKIKSKYFEIYPISSQIDENKLISLLNSRSGVQCSIKQISNDFSCSYSTLLKFVKEESGFRYAAFNVKNYRVDSITKCNEVILYALELFQRLHESMNAIYIDETSYAKSKNTARIWRRKGFSNFAISRPSAPYLNQILAISAEGVVHSKILVTTNNKLIFLEFMEELVTIANRKFNNNYFIVLDNCSIHASKICKAFFFQNNIDVLFLASYMPEHNSVELVFNLIKAEIKKLYIKVSTMKKIQVIISEKVTEILNNISHEKYMAFSIKVLDNIINYINNNK